MKSKKMLLKPIKSKIIKEPPKKYKIAHPQQAWQLQEAKTHFSAVVKAATEKGPQQITVHGEPTAMLISMKEYEQLTQPKLSLYEFMQQSPLAELDIEFERQDSLTRDIAL
jgi:prevent-host-death family protein